MSCNCLTFKFKILSKCGKSWKKMRAELCYISTACNHKPNICDWGKNGLVCYGACNSVVVYNPKFPGTGKDVRILTGHLASVNAVRWIRRFDSSSEFELASGSSDKTAIIWNIDGNTIKKTILKGHEDGVNIIEAIYINDDTLYVATASTDSTIKIWRRVGLDGEVEIIQTLDFNRGFGLALKFTFLPNSDLVLLACARENSKIELYGCVTQEEIIFKRVSVLSGHERWVLGLDFTNDNGNVYLASSSQDNFIRIWCISLEHQENEILGQTWKYNLDDNFPVKTKEGVKRISVRLESVLSGHDGWVYSVNWSSQCYGTGSKKALLSASLDKTMVIWLYNHVEKLWVDVIRVGEVGGNTLGFYGAVFSSVSSSILGHGYAGSIHLWNLERETDRWVPGVTVGGHFREVSDLAWEPNGAYVLTVSHDQSTRLHAPWVQPASNSVSWHEITRPQVHGYDMSCLAILSRYEFVSGAEEKIIRAFAAPVNFVTNFRTLCHVSDDEAGDKILAKSETQTVPRGASVPSLGLSNKAVFSSDNADSCKTTKKDPYPEVSYFHEVNMDVPPTEETLIQNTLWPETQKLYGHGYELFALAASHDGKIIASACKSTTFKHAAILIWEQKDNEWVQTQKLFSHTLTVTRIIFSPDDTKILSASRDRRWTVFERNSDTNKFEVKATTDKHTGIHTRIIWCCSWTHDSKYFATCSRDGKVVIWWENKEITQLNSVLGQYEAASKVLELKKNSVTAVAFAPCLVDGCYLLSLGLETGFLLIYKWSVEKGWEKCLEIDQSNAHHLAVKRVLFRPQLGIAGIQGSSNVLQLASCSSDSSVKINNIILD